MKFFVPIEAMEKVEIDNFLLMPLFQTMARFKNITDILKAQGMKMIQRPNGFFWTEKPEPHRKYFDPRMMCDVYETEDN